MFKTLLIIGSSGFIGKSIIDYLKKNTSLSKKFNKLILLSKSKKNKIPKLLERKYKVIQILADIKKIKKIPISDFIIYSAISKNIDQDPQCIKNFCKLIKKYKNRCSVLYISSGAVYGLQKNKNKKIKDNQVVKVSNDFIKSKKKYSIIKIKNEKNFQNLNKKNLKISVARCFAFVGKYLPLNSKFVIGNIINSILNKKTINIKSKINVIRSYMYSDILAEIILKIVLENKLNFVTYNVGSDDPINIHKVSKFFAKKNKLKFSFYKNIDNSKNEDRYVPDISKFRKNFNYNKKLGSINAVNKTLRDLTY